MDLQKITQELRNALPDLLQCADLKKGDLFVVGCSTSEIGGNMIGTSSSEELAVAVMDAIYPLMQEKGLYLAVQCCEHLNRALVVERAAMEKHDFTEVCVKPWLHAGGAFALRATEVFDDPVMVEDIKAKAAAGIDIGGTFIGMHLRPVVVPVHSAHKSVGMATLRMARTRPKYVGGERARYRPLREH